MHVAPGMGKRTFASVLYFKLSWSHPHARNLTGWAKTGRTLTNTRARLHPLSWLLSNDRLEKVPFVSVPHTSSNRLLLSNQDKGCTPSVAHSLPLPLGPALLNLSLDCIGLCLHCPSFYIHAPHTNPYSHIPKHPYLSRHSKWGHNIHTYV